MGDHPDGSLAAFWERLKRSPVRWLVLVHAAFLVLLIVLRMLMPTNEALRLLDSSLGLGQVALLLIWLTLDGRATMRRTLGAAFVAVFIQACHELPYGGLAIDSSMVCVVPAIFLALTVLALPLSIARGLGLQLNRFDWGNMPPPRRLQFSIRGVLFVSVVVAVLFGLKGAPEMLDRWPGSRGNSVAAALAIVTMALAITAIYVSTPLVAAWVMLTPGRILPRLATALVGWALGVVLLFHYTQAGEGAIRLGVPVGATVGGIVILLGTLLVLRAMRYRVVWAKP